ncbi:MAG: TIM barrel protein [Oscillospiraceae bacterium]|nr:TIM barrel protein [Oscillospiraceae bacterium]
MTNPLSPLFGPAGNSDSFRESGLKHTYQAFAGLAEMGLTAYEYSAGHGVSGSTETFAKIGEEAAKHGIKLSFHAPYYISLSSPDPAIRARSIGHIGKSLAAAEAMGADIIVIHPGGTAVGRDEAMHLTKETLLAAIDRHRDTAPHIRLGIETMGKQGLLGTLDEVLEICCIHPRLAPVVDFGHMWARQCGETLLTEADFEAVFDAISAGLGAGVAQNLHCHFSKIEFTTAGEKKHVRFCDQGYGPDPRLLMNVIARRGLTPRIICESAGTQAEDAVMMREMWMQGARAMKN